MNEFLGDDAFHVLQQYRAEVITDSGIALDVHRLFAFELIRDGLATAEEARESERALSAALSRVTRPQSVNTVLKPAHEGAWNVEEV